ncbi:uncharacterized protein I303_105224 [Kwoniella dejecticola CBS 10117]|uniref:C3H1-type domain-containing protein n=1 Tax=Kwoniella dejecticola CBS 10117 TaxID=1296121 RepID=A0A1A6A338_9TREE|nr:uncharacterized protein I303_05329 [Kwoniella dejecticola CBS 10117]OBR84471.1 hypothetical protein I303_05329 [Kwoniella dejecticola CBS 10117]
MAIEPSTSVPQGNVSPTVQQLKAEQQENANGNGHAQEEQIPNGEMEGLEGQMSGVALGELHAACAEGRLDDVRAVLSRGLEGLETLDQSMCTPIVLAIRGNHYDVVRELLSAGAIVPPPQYTNDPAMLSILYPQPMYGMPSQYMNMPPQEFYQQQSGFYPVDPQQQRGMFMPPQPPSGPRKDAGVPLSPNGGNASNLPPADVSKTIPCRNFPNCKYGASCVFYHPGSQPFFPSGPGRPNGFVPQGYENGGYPAPYPSASAPYFVPNNQAFVPEQQQPASDIPQPQQPQQLDTQHEQIASAPLPVPVPVPVPQAQHVPSAIAPVFVPGFQSQAPPAEMMSPPPSHFGMSPLSPSLMGTSLPSIPPAEAFFAGASPTQNGFMPPPPVAVNGAAAHARRQSFNQQQFGMPGKPFGHGKKASFSGGPKPWMGRNAAVNGAGGKFGSWKDGNPPPCAFFAQGNCRNGLYCKFPHLDAEGNDSRHPDVVSGHILPVNAISRGPRRMMGGAGYNGPIDPNLRQQHYQQQQQILQQQRLAAAQAQQGSAVAPAAVAEGESQPESSSAPVTASVEATSSESAQKEETTVPAVTVNDEKPSTTEASSNTNTTALPAKPVVPAMSGSNIIRSASQPGVQRGHLNGNASRSHSPAPSNVSFHGNGHPRRAGSRVPGPAGPHAHAQANGHYINGRSSSAGEKKMPSAPLQRVPLAHEFPALGLGSGSGSRPGSNPTTPSTEKKEHSWNGKTAAQVLSAPAPPKPEPVVKVQVTDTEGSESGKSAKESVTMDSDAESDAVIISTKPSSAAPSGTASPAPGSSSTPTPAPAAAQPQPEIKKAPISFASAVGAAGIAPLESTPVALKA